MIFSTKIATCSQSLVSWDLSVILNLDELVVPILGGLHPPGEEETEDDEWEPDDEEEGDSNSTSKDTSEDDDGEGAEEGVGDEASHSNDDSSSSLNGVSSSGVLDDKEEEHELREVDEDHDDKSDDSNGATLGDEEEESNGVDAVPDIDQGPHGNRVDSAHHGEATTASDFLFLVRSRLVNDNDGGATGGSNLGSTSHHNLGLGHLKNLI